VLDVYFNTDETDVACVIFIVVVSNSPKLSTTACSTLCPRKKCDYIFSTWQHIAYMLSALCICYCPSIRLSVCPSHRWISQKRLKLGLCNFHHMVAPPL